MDAAKNNTLALNALLVIYSTDHYAMLVVVNLIALIETAKPVLITILLNHLKDSVLFIHAPVLHVLRVMMHLMDFIKMVAGSYKLLIVSLIMEPIVFNAKDIDSPTQQYYMDYAIPTIANYLHSLTVQITAWQTLALVRLLQVHALLQIA